MDVLRDAFPLVLDVFMTLYAANLSNAPIGGFAQAFSCSAAHAPVGLGLCQVPAWSDVPEPHQQCPALGQGPPSAARDAQFLQLTQQLQASRQCMAGSGNVGPMAATGALGWTPSHSGMAPCISEGLSCLCSAASSSCAMLLAPAALLVLHLLLLVLCHSWYRRASGYRDALVSLHRVLLQAAPTITMLLSPRPKVLCSPPGFYTPPMRAPSLVYVAVRQLVTPGVPRRIQVWLGPVEWLLVTSNCVLADKLLYGVAAVRGTHLLVTFSLFVAAPLLVPMLWERLQQAVKARAAARQPQQDLAAGSDCISTGSISSNTVHPSHRRPPAQCIARDPAPRKDTIDASSSQPDERGPATMGSKRAQRRVGPQAEAEQTPTQVTQTGNEPSAAQGRGRTGFYDAADSSDACSLVSFMSDSQLPGPPMQSRSGPLPEASHGRMGPEPRLLAISADQSAAPDPVQESLLAAIYPPLHPIKTQGGSRRKPAAAKAVAPSPTVTLPATSIGGANDMAHGTRVPDRLQLSADYGLGTGVGASAAPGTAASTAPGTSVEHGPTLPVSLSYRGRTRARLTSIKVRGHPGSFEQYAPRLAAAALTPHSTLAPHVLACNSRGNLLTAVCVRGCVQLFAVDHALPAEDQSAPAASEASIRAALPDAAALSGVSVQRADVFAHSSHGTTAAGVDLLWVSPVCLAAAARSYRSSTRTGTLLLKLRPHCSSIGAARVLIIDQGSNAVLLDSTQPLQQQADGLCTLVLQLPKRAMPSKPGAVHVVVAAPAAAHAADAADTSPLVYASAVLPVLPHHVAEEVQVGVQRVRGDRSCGALWSQLWQPYAQDLAWVLGHLGAAASGRNSDSNSSGGSDAAEAAAGVAEAVVGQARALGLVQLAACVQQLHHNARQDSCGKETGNAACSSGNCRSDGAAALEPSTSGDKVLRPRKPPTLQVQATPMRSSLPQLLRASLLGFPDPGMEAAAQAHMARQGVSNDGKSAAWLAVTALMVLARQVSTAGIRFEWPAIRVSSQQCRARLPAQLQLFVHCHADAACLAVTTWSHATKE